MEEVKSKRRNLVCMWLDYKNAFDSVPHDWLIKALHLPEVPLEIITAIEALVVYKSVFVIYCFPIGIYLQKSIFKNIMMTSGFIFKNILAHCACQKKL